MNNVVKIDDAAVNAFVLKLVSDAVWSVLYHENHLLKDHQKVAVAKSVAAKFGGVDLSAITADDFNEYEEDEPTNTNDFVLNFVAEAMWGVRYHEQQLREAHAQLAGVKALLARIAADIDLDKIWSEQRERLNERLKEKEDEE